jgi:3-oxoacyl-[acyl-carrier-protein] synthase-3
MQSRRSRIAGMGAYLPERVVSSDELAAYFGTTRQWILDRTGILERRFAAVGEGTAAMGAAAARRAIQDAGWLPQQVEFIIFATSSPDHFTPGAGCYMQAMLDLPNIGVIDVRNQCSGFVYALTLANALIVAGQYSRILIVCAEVHSHVLEHPSAPPDVAILFGDGAAAVALEASSEEGFITSTLHADGRGADALKLELFDIKKRPYITAQDLENGRQFPVMDGAQVFLSAVNALVKTSSEVLVRARKTLADVDLLIPHQANLRINEMVRRRLRLPEEKVLNNIQTRGNIGAGSIPLAMVEARDAGVLKRGDLLLALAFGAGFAWGGTLLRF